METKILNSIIENKGRNVYCIVRKVDSSYMSRQLTFYCLVDNSMINMDKLICEALKLKRNKNGDAIILHGCGMSLKYATLYDYYRKKGITDYDRLAANANTL